MFGRIRIFKSIAIIAAIIVCLFIIETAIYLNIALAQRGGIPTKELIERQRAEIHNRNLKLMEYCRQQDRENEIAALLSTKKEIPVEKETIENINDLPRYNSAGDYLLGISKPNSGEQAMALNNPIGVVSKAATNTSNGGHRYEYDVNNRRVYKYDGESTVRYFGDWINVWSEIFEGGIESTYIMDGNAPLIKHTPSGTYYYHCDHLGTPILITDEYGNPVWKGEYEPFGKCKEVISTVDNPIRFPGQYEDKETGFHYNHHRYYDPSTGRYTREDPISIRNRNIGENNYYAYALNNINSYFDNTGLQCSSSQYRKKEWLEIISYYNYLLMNHIFITNSGHFAWYNDCFFFAEITEEKIMRMKPKCFNVYEDKANLFLRTGAHNVVRVKEKCCDNCKFIYHSTLDPYRSILYRYGRDTKHVQEGIKRGNYYKKWYSYFPLLDPPPAY